MQVLVDISDPASIVFHKSLHEIKKICSIREVLPKLCTILDSLLDISLLSVSGYVSQGILDGSKVRIKCVRMYPKGALWEVCFQRHIFPYSWALMKAEDLLPGSCSVETLDTPEYCPPSRHHHQSPPIYF